MEQEIQLHHSEGPEMRFVNTTKVTALAFAVAMLATATPASAKCKFQADTVHRITGQKVLWTEWDTFRLTPSRNGYLVHAGIIEGDQEYLGLRITVRNSTNYRPDKAALDNALRVSAQAKLLLLLADESILELYSDRFVRQQ